MERRGKDLSKLRVAIDLLCGSSELRAAIDADGCAVLKGFVRAERIAELVVECDLVAGHGHRNFNRTNPYFTQDRPELPEQHPLRNG